MKRVLRISGWVILLGCITTIGVLIQSSHRKLICEKPLVTIVPEGVGFVDNTDVDFAIIEAGIETEGQYIDSINTGVIEHALLANPHIESADVFTTINGQLFIEIRQRTPIARVIRADGLSCYVEANGEVMKLSNKHTAHVVVFTGNIPDPVMDWGISRVENNDSLATEYLIDDIYRLAEFIANDQFWKAQIQQVYVNEKGEMELLPRVGSHRIMLGKAEGLAEKFEKLMLLYEEGFGKANWNMYDTINLKYANQVVCSKRD